MKVISIVLTRHLDGRFNQVTSRLCGSEGYNHISLCLDDEQNRMYSFSRHGFCTETKAWYRNKGVEKSISYAFRIPDECYEKLQKAVEFFSSHKRRFHYTKLGAALCLLKIPFRWKNHYFCSQFVAEVLSESGILKLRKAPSLYLPNRLCAEVLESLKIENSRQGVV